MEAVANGNGFEFCYERDMTTSYLVAKAPGKSAVQHYQVEMMINNNIAGMLPFNLRNRNGETIFYYDITSRLPLSHFIKREVKRNHLLDILASMVKTLVHSKNYFLPQGNFIYNAEYIFVNPSTLETHMTYIPINKAGNVLEKFKELVVYIVTGSEYTAEYGSDNFLQKILSYIKRDNFNIVEFGSFLRDLKGVSSSEKVSEEKEVLGCKGGEMEAGTEGQRNSIQQNSISSILRFKNTRIALALGLQIVVVLVAVAGSVLLKPLSDDPVTVYGGISIVAVALDLLALRKLFDKKTVTVKESMKKTSNSKDEHRLKREIQIRSSDDALECTPGNINYLPGNGKVNTTVKGGNDTVLLGCSGDGKPYMRCIKDGIAEEISITGKEFVIGRLKEQVDHAVDNNAVGKVHAVITTRDGDYFIKDLNSRNGTFVNNKRLDSNKDYIIKNNDKIGLANKEYIFTIP